MISRGKPVIIGVMKGKTVMNFEDIIKSIKPLDQWEEVHSYPIGDWSGYETLTKKKYTLRIVKDSENTIYGYYFKDTLLITKAEFGSDHPTEAISGYIKTMLKH